MSAVNGAAPKRGWKRIVIPVAAVGAVIGVTIGLVFLVDKQGAPNLLANVYDLIGNQPVSTPWSRSWDRHGVAV